VGIMLLHFSDEFWKQVAVTCMRNLEVTATVSKMGSKIVAEAASQGTEVFDPESFERIENIRKLNVNSSFALSREDIVNHRQTEAYFLRMSDRLCVTPISVRKRLSLYYELLAFWLNYLRQGKVSALFVQSTPHLGYDFVIYSIARSLRIPTFIFAATMIESKMLVFRDHETVSKVPADFVRDASREELVKMLGPDMKLLFGSNYWLGKSDEINARVLYGRTRSEESPIHFAKNVLKRVRRWSRRILSRQSPLDKLRSYLFYEEKRPKSTAQLRRILRESNRKQAALAAYYEENCIVPEWDKKYVFFALHYQPERTTLPEGGVFEDQILALRILSSSLPKDWVIYVKEHPRQFEENDLRKSSFRNVQVYEAMSRIPHTLFVSAYSEQQRLIERAQFVATINGSVGWQGMLVGKCALVFGRPWYSGANGCYVVSSTEECRNAISDIRSRSAESVINDVYRFVLYNKNRFFSSAWSEDHARNGSVPYGECVTNMAMKIAELTRETLARTAVEERVP